MIIEIEDRFCKAAMVFSKLLDKVRLAAQRGDAIHEVEEMTWSDLIEAGRETVAAFIEEQKASVPRPEEIAYEGKALQRLPEPRVRSYVSVFGPTPFERDVYALRETQRQEVVPLDAKLGMPQNDTSYLLQKWSGAQFVKESYQQSRITLEGVLGFAPSVNCLEDMAAQASEHAEVYFEQQTPVDPATEKAILVATSDCKGVPMRKIDAPRKKRDAEPHGKRLKKGEKNGQKRMACVGGVYSVAPFCRTAEEVIDEILRKNKQKHRPEPRNKRLRAILTREVNGEEVNGKEVIFDWLADEVHRRDPRNRRTVVAIMDGETKLRDLQERTLGRAIGILDIWHVTEYLWKLAYCFHPEGSEEATAFVETYLRKLLEGKVTRAIGGIRQMATKRSDLSKPRQEKLEQYLNYFVERRAYMKYDKYLAAGYPIGSGVVEGACRHLVKDRMEQTGMRWRIAGAQAILTLRAIYINDDWEAFHADRIQTEQRKLYPYKNRLKVILNCAA